MKKLSSAMTKLTPPACLAFLRGAIYGLFLPVWIARFQQEGWSLLQIGILGSVFEATKFLAEIPTGHYSDSRGSLFSLRISTVLLCAAFLIFDQHGFSFLILAHVLLALSECFHFGAFEHWVSDSHKEASVIKSSLVNIYRYSLLGFLIASPFAGFLGFALWKICLILAFGALILVFSQTQRKANSKDSSSQETGTCLTVKEKIKGFFADPSLVSYGTSFFLLSFVFDGISRFYQSDLMLSGLNAKYLGSISFLVALVGYFLLTPVRKSVEKSPLRSRSLIRRIDVGVFVLLLLVAFVGSLYVHCVAFLALLSMEDVRMPLLSGEVSSQSKHRHSLATNLSILSVMGALGEFFSGFMSGYVSTHYSTSVLWLFYAILLVVGAGLGYAVSFKKQRLACADSQDA